MTRTGRIGLMLATTWLGTALAAGAQEVTLTHRELAQR